MSVFPFIPTSTVTLVWRQSRISTWNHFPSKTNRCPWTHQGVVVWFQCFTPTVSAMFVQSCFNQLKHIKHTPSKGVSNNIEKRNQRYIFIKIPWMWEHRLVFTAWHFPDFCLFEGVSCCEHHPVYVCGSTHTIRECSNPVSWCMNCLVSAEVEQKQKLCLWMIELWFNHMVDVTVFHQTPLKSKCFFFSLCPPLTIAKQCVLVRLLFAVSSFLLSGSL